MKLQSAGARLVMATVGAVALISSSAAQEAEQDAQEDAAPQETTEQEAASREPIRMFVADKLVLNVYSEPAQNGERVATIETGDAVEALERADAFVRVRLADGQEGWVGSNYLTMDAPAAVRLRELQRQQKATAAPDKKSTEEIARLRKQNAALESEMKALKETAAAAQSAAASPGETQTFDEAAADQEPRAASESGVSEASTIGSTVLIALLVAAIAGSAGFAAGYHTLARRIRQKFGGLKIY